MPEALEAPAPARPAAKATPVATPLPAKIAYPLAALCGFLYFLAFPGIDLWPLAFVALVPLIVALRGQTPRRAAAARLDRRLHHDDVRLLLAARDAPGLQRLPARRSA